MDRVKRRSAQDSKRRRSADDNWRSGTQERLQSVVQNDIQQRAVNFQLAVVADESLSPKLLHRGADFGASLANQLGQSLLTHFGNHRLGLAFLAEIGKQEKDPREPFLARVE